MNAEQAAGKWGKSLRVIQKYCSQGKIEGAEKVKGGIWEIPNDASAPSDELDKRHKRYSKPEWFTVPKISKMFNIPISHLKYLISSPHRRIDSRIAENGTKYFLLEDLFNNKKELWEKTYGKRSQEAQEHIVIDSVYYEYIYERINDYMKNKSGDLFTCIQNTLGSDNSKSEDRIRYLVEKIMCIEPELFVYIYDLNMFKKYNIDAYIRKYIISSDDKIIIKCQLIKKTIFFKRTWPKIGFNNLRSYSSLEIISGADEQIRESFLYSASDLEDDDIVKNWNYAKTEVLLSAIESLIPNHITSKADRLTALRSAIESLTPDERNEKSQDTSLFINEAVKTLGYDKETLGSDNILDFYKENYIPPSSPQYPNLEITSADKKKYGQLGDMIRELINKS